MPTTFQNESDHDQNYSATSSNPPQPHCCRERRFSDPCDGVLLQVRSVRCKLRTRPLIFLLKAHAVPVVDQTGILPLPILQEGNSYGKDTMPMTMTLVLPQKDMKTA